MTLMGLSANCRLCEGAARMRSRMRGVEKLPPARRDSFANLSSYSRNISLSCAFAHRDVRWRLRARRLGSNPMSKNRFILTGFIALRRTLTISTLLIACASCPCDAPAGEINAVTARPIGFAEIVAKVKPAVIAVTVRLESDAQMESDEPDAPSRSQPSARTHPCIATSSAALSGSRRPDSRSKWPWDQAFLFPLMGMQ